MSFSFTRTILPYTIKNHTDLVYKRLITKERIYSEPLPYKHADSAYLILSGSEKLQKNNKLAPSESSTSDGAKSLRCPLDCTSLYFSLVHSTSSVLYRGLWTGFVFDQWLLFKTPSCSSSYLLPLVSWIECGAWVASYLNLCSLWTVPPILKFRLGILSFPLFVLSCFDEFNISHN